MEVADTDFDSDGILNCQDPDDDNDGVPDETDADDDDDGIPDEWELDNGLNPLFDDADEDPDGDGFSNFSEYMADTNPQDADDFPPLPTIELSLPSGWSMISLPVTPENTSLSNLFPDAVVVYGYEKGIGYVQVKPDEELEVGRGYWILLNEAQSYTLTGQPIESYTHPVATIGWLMIGRCTDPARVIPHSCNIVVIYGFNPEIGYKRVPEPESLEPGKGYWILFGNTSDGAEFTASTSISE